jgi:hypothetical protein
MKPLGLLVLLAVSVAVVPARSHKRKNRSPTQISST